jgi:hypothetical protein
VGYVVGLSDFGAMVMSVGERGAWTSALFGITGETLATCDSTWPVRAADDRCVSSSDAVNQLYRAASSVAAAEQSLP